MKFTRNHFMDGEASVASNETSLPEPEQTSEVSTPPRRYIVGLGASAGGLEALSILISHLPPDLATSYVIIQHMSPTHRSMLVQLLARETEMPVSEIEDGEVPLPDHIYVTPPNRNVVLQDGRFVLTEPAPEVMPKPSVNAFLSSLAEERGEDAIAVILSGTGSDGALGVRAVKASGGLVFAQEPTSAKYSGMPQAAIDTECVDWTMSPELIAAEIGVIIRAQGAISLPVRSEHAPATLRTLLQRVMRHARVDFSGYKESTVWRRILRRMVSNRVHTMEDYLALTEKNPEELNQLCKEILISVTSFFRDPRSFEHLRELLGELLAGKLPGEEVRVWVAGCATGEEAYSIAILVSELLGRSLPDFRVQIFATDIDLNAMAVARRGVYPESGLAEMPPDLVQRYFVRREGTYEVSKSLRDMVVFARQDLAQDPPFLRLDLVTCRNVLIYFQSMLQEQVLTTFHYALKPGALLFLGKSETAHQREGMFDPISREAKIFRRREGDARLPAQTVANSVAMGLEQRPIVARTRAQTQDESLVKAVLEATMPPAVVITSQLDIRHVFGDVSPYLNIPTGRPDFNLLNLIRPEWRIETQTLIYQAIQRRVPIMGRLHGGQDGVRLQVRPLPLKFTNSEDALLVGFEQVPALDDKLAEGDGTVSPATQSLEEELTATREHLQTVIEELETSNEETQALNEELQASNEELQASNEELQASNEELQSTNEELTTVNEELQIKTAELADTNADLENIQNSIGFLILVVNNQMRLVRHNSAAAQWLALGNNTIGESLRALPNVENYPDLIQAAEQVLREQRPLDRQVSHDGRHYLLRAMPRMMSTRETMGAVITLMEETELIETQRRLRENEQRLLAVMNHSATVVAVKDMSGRYEYVNPRFCEVFGVSAEKVLGLTDRQIFDEPLAVALRERDLDTLRADQVVEQREHLILPGGEREFHGIRFPIKGEDGVTNAICLKLADVGAAWHDR
jgi:two-component system, chemotaxis family, CheB/CheR fusion protein